MREGAGPLLEIAANSLASALAAQEGGADRIELCASLGEGGLTPSYATIALVRERLAIPVYVLIRPRAGDFLYHDFEIETMCHDIEACARLGCDGVVIGALDADGNVAIDKCRTLIAATGSLGVTFHRAFDLTRDANAALEDIIVLGCKRVLTSGQASSASEGVAAIRTLIAQANGRIAIMPGAGINSANIAAIRGATGADEFHASAKRTRTSAMHWRPNRLIDMQGGELRSDCDEIWQMRAALSRAVRAT
ncbi:MAG TPA: copper homeostasis protein CutC [Rhodanobacteraceae bacterium]|jgi:copper homeostasis protein|nr:copper homeostasis protein CutC [Rhodanobacteraceae bacterium]